MQIEYLTTKSRRTVSDAVGNVLIARKLARGIYDTRELTPEPLSSAPAQPPISPVTGKPKRQYRRRDMQATE